MLVLSRKQGESIMIGDVRVYVTKITPERVRIGVEAPTNVRVIRRELLDNKDQTNDE